MPDPALGGGASANSLTSFPVTLHKPLINLVNINWYSYCFGI